MEVSEGAIEQMLVINPRRLLTRALADHP
jgi:hypothetical protein